MKLWSLLGNSQKLDGGAMFGNVPRAMWEHWIEPDADNRIPLACRALLADGLDGRRVLFETGIGAFFEPKLRERFGVVESRHVLLDSLAEAGLTHEDIDVVVLSHLHFDHAGGCCFPMRASWSAPNAGSVPAIRTRATAPASSPNCRRCWRRAGGWRSSSGRTARRSGRRCDSITARGIPRA